MTMTMQGEELKRLRKYAGLTQAQLGAQIGLSGPYVGEMEREEKAIHPHIDAAVRHAANPVQFYEELQADGALKAEVNRLLDRVAEMQHFSGAEIAGLVRDRHGNLFIGRRRIPDLGEL